MIKLLVLYSVIFLMLFALVFNKIVNAFFKLRRRVYTFLVARYGEQTVHGVYAFIGGILFGAIILFGLLFIILMDKIKV